MKLYKLSFIVILTNSFTERPQPFRLWVFQIGGELCENDDWRMSQFAVGVLDTDTLDYKTGRDIIVNLVDVVSKFLHNTEVRCK